MIYEKDLEKTAGDYHNTIIQGWEGLYSSLREALLNRISPFFFGTRLLEMGCGDGEMTQYFTQYFESITVVDGSETMLNECRNRLLNDKIKFELSLFEEYVPENKFETIIMSHILEHLDEPVKMLEIVSTWLKKDGRIIVAVPNAGSLHRRAAVKMGLLKTCDSLNNQDLLLGHRRVYYPEVLKEHCKLAGLNVKHFGGVMLKALTNRQIEENWSSQMIEAFILLGDDLPELCAEMFVVLEKD
jgi:2-polyprenyl-3-methyl-5-hydroxy-6-metoxy-1,4-benzoquinol methylase